VVAGARSAAATKEASTSRAGMVEILTLACSGAWRFPPPLALIISKTAKPVRSSALQAL
jgi:hypothetical protein